MVRGEEVDLSRRFSGRVRSGVPVVLDRLFWQGYHLRYTDEKHLLVFVHPKDLTPDEEFVHRRDRDHIPHLESHAPDDRTSRDRDRMTECGKLSSRHACPAPSRRHGRSAPRTGVEVCQVASLYARAVDHNRPSGRVCRLQARVPSMPASLRQCQVITNTSAISSPLIE